LCLYAEAKAAENIDLLTRRIFDIVKKVHPEVTIGNSVESRPATELSLQDIISKFEHIFKNMEWTWEKILNDAKISCGLLEEINTSDINQHPTKVVQHFQVIILQFANSSKTHAIFLT
jgi:hypothetical protein